MTKVYKAIDNIDGKESIFTILKDGSVNVSIADWGDDAREVKYIKEWEAKLTLSDASRAEDMINPVLLAEW